MSKNGTIVLVGHCGPDSWALKSAIGSAVPGATIIAADSNEELEESLEDAALLLVNRVLDGRFDEPGGVDLIRRLGAGGRGPKTMLVSNYGEAQREAEAAGALPGFGKKEMYAAATREKLLRALGLV